MRVKGGGTLFVLAFCSTLHCHLSFYSYYRIVTCILLQTVMHFVIIFNKYLRMYILCRWSPLLNERCTSLLSIDVKNMDLRIKKTLKETCFFYPIIKNMEKKTLKICFHVDSVIQSHRRVRV